MHLIRNLSFLARIEFKELKKISEVIVNNIEYSTIHKSDVK